MKQISANKPSFVFAIILFACIAINLNVLTAESNSFSLSGISQLFTEMLFPSAVASCCTTMCNTDECSVYFNQCPEGWWMIVNCGSSGSGIYDGEGQYSGTLCNGMSPCQVG